MDQAIGFRGDSRARLAAAISDFEKRLSTEQRNILCSYKAQLHGSAPSPSDVMKLTAEIDFQASTKVRGRCFGPRLTNILQTVQQFAALGDVTIGGSQNLVACGIWSLSTVNSISYFDNISKLLMAVGRSSPRYQELGLIYQGSQRLQSHLCEYLIVVVSLCSHICDFMHKSIFGQYISSQVDPALKGFESELYCFGNAIEKEAQFQLAHTIERESQKNSKFRTYLTMETDNKKLLRKKKTKLKIMDLCSRYDHESIWKQTRKAGRTTLFSKDALYTSWKQEAKADTIIFTGKLGSGKSVLMANLVDDLHLSVQSRDTPVTFFFCRHDILESLQARTVIGSLARQLLRTDPSLELKSDILADRVTLLESDDILNLLKQMLPNGYKAFFVLDGIDECDATERYTIITCLRDLQNIFNLSICLSVRPEPNDALSLSLTTFDTPLVLMMPDDNPDISAYIKSELESSLKSGRLVLRDPGLILEIHDALLERSQGMFLWVVLQIDSLYETSTDEAIRQALKDLPRDLSETFSRILRRSNAKPNDYRKRIFEFVTAAFRPLTTEEIREALSVVHGETLWDATKILNDVRPALSSCRSLLIIDEENYTVRFAHHSVKQFLLNSTIADFMISADNEMTNTIITYLSYNIFETQVSRNVIPQLSATSAISTIVGSTLESKRIRDYALRLLSSRSHSDHNINKTIAEANQVLNKQFIERHNFYQYAKMYWLQHIHFNPSLDPKVSALAFPLLREDVTELNKADDQGQTLLANAVKRNDFVLVRLLLKVDGIRVNIEDSYGRTPLCLAIIEKHNMIAEYILSMVKVDVNHQDHGRRTPLHWAIESNNTDIVRLIMRIYEVDLNVRDLNGETPLHLAVQGRDETIVRLLLEQKRIDIDVTDNGNKTPLYWAVRHGNKMAVELLLQFGDVDVNRSYDLGSTVLQIAIETMTDERHAVLPLKEKGRRIRHEDYKMETIVQLLLDMDGIEINKKNDAGQTPLHTAVVYQKEGIVRTLLGTNGVDVNSEDMLGKTPLRTAIERQNESIVRLLLKTGKVKVDCEDSEGRTPLHWAVRDTGNVAIVKLLLDNVGIKAISDNSGRFPSDIARATGQTKELIGLLKQAGRIASRRNAMVLKE